MRDLTTTTMMMLALGGGPAAAQAPTDDVAPPLRPGPPADVPLNADEVLGAALAGKWQGTFTLAGAHPRSGKATLEVKPLAELPSIGTLDLQAGDLALHEALFAVTAPRVDALVEEGVTSVCLRVDTRGGDALVLRWGTLRAPPGEKLATDACARAATPERLDLARVR
ncbi:MAG: hypothetical protein U1F43_11590 [Myxococcota bacterium]